MDGLERYHKLMMEQREREVRNAVNALRAEIYQNFMLVSRIVDPDENFIVDPDGNFIEAL